jgi:acyl-CoA thioesterase FadM
MHEHAPTTVLEWDASKAYETIQGGGPQGQPLFVFRFPLTFRDSATPMSTLYFSSFADWMGKARELGGMQQTDFHPRLFEIFGEGTYGGVTNFFETTILGRAGHSDVVEGRFCMDDCTETEYTASCEWRRIPYPSGSPERIAFTRMRTSSVRILGHGVAKPAPWPEDFYEYLVSMRPTQASTRPLANIPTSLEGLEIGEAVWRADDVDAGLPLAQQVFSTSLQDSNLVGNLYFSNYSGWQGRLRDRLLHDIAPECFDLRQLGAQPECLFFSTHHLREAMPFDSIEAQMSVKAMYEGALDLWFDYYRVDMTGTREKLAVGEHRVALVSASQDSPQVVPWPSRARERLHRMLGRPEPESAAAETA